MKCIFAMHIEQEPLGNMDGSFTESAEDVPHAGANQYQVRVGYE